MVIRVGGPACGGHGPAFLHRRPPRPREFARGDTEAVQAYLRQWIAYEMHENQIQGLSIALVEGQKIIWAEGFGHADVAHRIEATPDTLYRIGSISKLFNAVAALQLAERGPLDLDRPIQSYLPDFAIRSRFTPHPTFTARQLMTHHSGLPTDYLNGWNSEEPIRYVRQQLKDEYMAYPPNTLSAYSNLGATVLGHVVETLYGFVEVSREGQRLWSQSGSDRMKLVPIGENEFRVEYKRWGLIPAGPKELQTHRFRYERVGSEELLLLVNDRGARRLIGKKIHPVPIPTAWLARLGHYSVPDAMLKKIKHLALRQDDRGFLYLEFDGERGVTLQPLSDQEAVIAGLGRGKQETVRAKEIDGVTHLYYSGLVHAQLKD